ncbi:MAG: lysA [Haloplasmataceae bacterium]|nr:lysA [Haloplasmataceae bacterium]
MKIFGQSKINKNGQLELGGCNVQDLVKNYGTPLYVVDEGLVRVTCQLFKQNLVSENVETEVIYASKAFLTLAMCKVIAEEGLGIDVVSGGELYTALKANFPASRIYFHGNNKSKEEIMMAVNSGIGRIVVDNCAEIDLIESVCASLNKKIHVLFRVNPGIEAHTHEYIRTTNNDSKFGESIFNTNIYEILNKLINSKYLIFKGLHSHIGSQIFEENSFLEQIRVMFVFIKTIKEQCNFTVDELNLGGGFGIYYADGDTPINLSLFLKELLNEVKNKANEFELKIPKIMIEPGRSIIANAGTTLYTVGSTKKTVSGKNYCFVDGSMADNIRTALYQAQYEAAVANRMNDILDATYTIAGKCCESGDVIVRNIKLAHPKTGDIIAVASTGAYNYSMSSNYNRLTRPAVVFVKDGTSRVVVKRETLDDLLRNDLM